jgi:hypothetical protein
MTGIFSPWYLVKYSTSKIVFNPLFEQPLHKEQIIKVARYDKVIERLVQHTLSPWEAVKELLNRGV